MSDDLLVLEVASADINEASGKLTAAVAGLDGRLQRLNLGVTAWVATSSGVELGYARIDGAWGIAIKEGEKEWLFANSPRCHRMEVMNAEYLAALFRELSRVAGEVTSKLRAATESAVSASQSFDAEK